MVLSRGSQGIAPMRVSPAPDPCRWAIVVQSILVLTRLSWSPHPTLVQISAASIHTVKTEIKAIYRKLGVSSRNDAVQRATAIGLLGT